MDAFAATFSALKQDKGNGAALTAGLLALSDAELGRFSECVLLSDMSADDDTVKLGDYLRAAAAAELERRKA